LAWVAAEGEPVRDSIAGEGRGDAGAPDLLRQIPKDIDLVFGSHRRQPGYIGRARGRRSRVRGRNTHFDYEAFETRGDAEEQDSGGGGAFDPKAVRDPTREVDVAAGAGLGPFAVRDERHLPFEDVERFVFEVVHVVGRSETGWNYLFEQSEGAIGVFAGGLNEGEAAKKPDCRLLS